jgi:hypothetical protein
MHFFFIQILVVLLVFKPVQILATNKDCRTTFEDTAKTTKKGSESFSLKKMLSIGTLAILAIAGGSLAYEQDRIHKEAERIIVTAKYGPLAELDRKLLANYWGLQDHYYEILHSGIINSDDIESYLALNRDIYRVDSHESAHLPLISGSTIKSPLAIAIASNAQKIFPLLLDDLRQLDIPEQTIVIQKALDEHWPLIFERLHSKSEVLVLLLDYLEERPIKLSANKALYLIQQLYTTNHLVAEKRWETIRTLLESGTFYVDMPADEAIILGTNSRNAKIYLELAQILEQPPQKMHLDLLLHRTATRLGNPRRTPTRGVAADQEMIAKLLDLGADPFLIYKEGPTFEELAKTSDPFFTEIFLKILNSQAFEGLSNAVHTYYIGEFALIAIQKNSPDLLAHLVATGLLDIHANNEQLLRLAIQLGRPDLAKELIDKYKADPYVAATHR